MVRFIKSNEVYINGMFSCNTDLYNVQSLEMLY